MPTHNLTTAPTTAVTGADQMATEVIGRYFADELGRRRGDVADARRSRDPDLTVSTAAALGRVDAAAQAWHATGRLTPDDASRALVAVRCAEIRLRPGPAHLSTPEHAEAIAAVETLRTWLRAQGHPVD